MRFLPAKQEERQRLFRLLFILDLGWFFLGFVITFVPGGEQYWFTIAACLFLFLVLLDPRGFRMVAAAFMLLSLFFALLGYWHGVNYQAWLAQHPLPIPATAPPP